MPLFNQSEITQSLNFLVGVSGFLRGATGCSMSLGSLLRWLTWNQPGQFLSEFLSAVKECVMDKSYAKGYRVALEQILRAI